MLLLITLPLGSDVMVSAQMQTPGEQTLPPKCWPWTESSASSKTGVPGVSWSPWAREETRRPDLLHGGQSGDPRHKLGKPVLYH